MCSVLLRGDSTQVIQERENHHVTVEENLKRWSGSRPPKTELTGVLVPCLKVVGGYLCLYKLETDSQNFFLKLSSECGSGAQRLEWKRVTVRGFLDPDDGLFQVERLRASHEQRSADSISDWNPGKLQFVN